LARYFSYSHSPQSPHPPRPTWPRSPTHSPESCCCSPQPSPHTRRISSCPSSASTCTTPCPPNKKPKAPSTAPYPPPPAAVVARVRRRSSTAPATPAAAGPGVPVAPRADPARAQVRVLGRQAPRPALPGQARARERRPAVETPLGLRRQGPRRRPWSGSRRRLLGLEPGTRLVGRPRGTPRRPIRPTTRHRQPPNLQAQPLTASAG